MAREKKQIVYKRMPENEYRKLKRYGQRLKIVKSLLSSAMRYLSRL